jgi:hypothetical protein
VDEFRYEWLKKTETILLPQNGEKLVIDYSDFNNAASFIKIHG